MPDNFYLAPKWLAGPPYNRKFIVALSWFWLFLSVVVCVCVCLAVTIRGGRLRDVPLQNCENSLALAKEI